MLLLFALVVGSVSSVWAEDVTFDYADYKGKGTSSSGSEYTMVKTDVSIRDTKFYGNNSQAHFYAGGTSTITPSSGVTITKIVLTATESSYNGFQSKGTVTPSTGSVSKNGATVTWEGSASSSFTIEHSKQIRWTSIVVTYTKTSSSPLASIAVSNHPTNFYVGDEFSHEGALVTATYEDNSTKDVTSSATFSTPDMTTAGTKTVTVTYTEGEVTKTATYNITVNARTLTSIALSGNYTTTFSKNAAFNYDGLVVTATYDDKSTKVVTEDATFSEPDMTTLGTKTVTVSYTEGGVTKTATYDITVEEYVQPTTITATFNNVFLGTQAGVRITEKTTVTQDGVMFVFDKISGSNWPQGDAEVIRIYDGTTLKIVAPSGYALNSITFTAKGDWKVGMDADCGTYNDDLDSNNKAYWTGVAESVTFSPKGSHRIATVVVTLTNSTTAKIASSGYSTLSAACGLDFANAVADNETADALVAYIIPRNDGAKLTMSTVTEASAGTGILLKGTPGVTYTILVKTNATAVGTNLLKAGPVTVPDGNETIYLLKSGQFHLASAGTTSAGKAYLELPAAVGAPALSIDNDDETTGIGMTTVNGQQTTDGVYYDLSGRRVAQPTKGLYIVNGKKIVIK